MNHPCPQVPDYQRLCALTSRIANLDPDDVTAVCLLRAIAADLTTLLQESLDRYGISEGRFRVMGHLLDRDGPATHSQLAEASGVTKGTVTGLIDGLEGDGLVRRIPSPDDRRVSLIELTPAGEKTLQDMLPGHLRRLSDLLGGVDKAERQTLTQLLRKVRAGLPAPRCDANKDEQ
jgi:DNA-binding MarR family transcriptional regulator